MTYESNQNTLRGSLAVLLATVLLCSGCVSSQLGPTVVDYNRAVEQAQNEMLLLNAVRAAKRQPLYLTDTTKITGSIRRDLTATLTLPFGSIYRKSMTPDSGAPGGTYSVNPTFDVNVLNAQEFMKKFTAPMDPEVFAFYWNEDFPPDLILHLFVVQVEVQTPDGLDEAGKQKFKTSARYSNHPLVDDRNRKQANTELRCFGEWVRWFSSNRPRLTAKDPDDAKIGPVLAATDSKISFTDLTAGTQTGYTIEEDVSKKGFQLKRTKKEYRFEFDPEKPFDFPECRPLKEKPSSDFPDAIDTSLAVVTLVKKSQAEAGGTTTPIGTAAVTASRTSGTVAPATPALKEEIKYRAVLHLRSHEALVYYLGQIVRLERNLSEVPLVAIQIRPDPLDEIGQPDPDARPYRLVPLFVAFPPAGTDAKGKPFPDCQHFAVRVADAESETYVIPRPPSSAVIPTKGSDPAPSERLCGNWLGHRGDQLGTSLDCVADANGDHYLGDLSCDAGESMHVLSILTQLIALEKTAKETPTTPVVRTVGQ
jgi:hypothetical protein